MQNRSNIIRAMSRKLGLSASELAEVLRREGGTEAIAQLSEMAFLRVMAALEWRANRGRLGMHSATAAAASDAASDDAWRWRRELDRRRSWNIDVEALSAPRRAELMFRLRAVCQVEQHVRIARDCGGRADDAMKEYADEIANTLGRWLTRSTLHNWRRAWHADGLRGLCDARWHVGTQGEADRAWFLAKLAEIYGGELIRVAEAHMLAVDEAEKAGRMPCTLRESRQHIQRHVRPRLTREKSYDGVRSRPDREPPKGKR